MKCEIASWGKTEFTCYQQGNCSQCSIAIQYMSLMGPGSFSLKLSTFDIEKKGEDLVATVQFNDNDPNIYRCTISKGVYTHLEKINANN